MRVLLADDHALVRDGMKPFLLDLADTVEILEAATFDQAVEIAGSGLVIDLALLDLRMPGMDGLNGLSKFRERFPDVQVVIVSGQYSYSDINSALERGARGYVPKTIGGEAMLNALRLVLAGERYVPSIFFETAKKEAARKGAMRGLPSDNPLAELTNREWQVLSELIAGHSNKQIGRTLGLEEITIKIHLRNVYRKMNVSNRAQAVRVALQSGWDDLQ
jgi:two-component system, NarL family, nitrate/nitrite response regulator NarL